MWTTAATARLFTDARTRDTGAARAWGRDFVVMSTLSKGGWEVVAISTPGDTPTSVLLSAAMGRIRQ